jgi:dipeptide/tripeptide permease
MQGKEVFKHAVTRMKEAAEKVIERAGLQPSMPPGVPHIIGNEAAERFSFYGMKAVLAVFMVHYLHLMDGGGRVA